MEELESTIKAPQSQWGSLHFSTTVSTLPQAFRTGLRSLACPSRGSAKHGAVTLRQSCEQSNPCTVILLPLCSAPASLRCAEIALPSTNWEPSIGYGLIVCIQKSCRGCSHCESGNKFYFNTSGWDVKSLMADGRTICSHWDHVGEGKSILILTYSFKPKAQQPPPTV